MTNFTRVAVNAAATAAALNAPFTEVSDTIDELFDGVLLNSSSLTLIDGTLVLADTSNALISISAESGVHDNLDTITGGKVGQILYLKAASGNSISLRHNIGNIYNITETIVTVSGDRIMPVMKIGSGWTSFIQFAASGQIIPHTEFNSPVTQIDFENIPVFQGLLRMLIGFYSNSAGSTYHLDIRANGYSGTYKAFSARLNNSGYSRNEQLSTSALALPYVLPAASASAGLLGAGVLDIHNAGGGSPYFVNYRGVLMYGTSTGEIYSVQAGGLIANVNITRINKISFSALTGGYDAGFYAAYILGG